MPNYQIYPQLKSFGGKMSGFLSKKFIFSLFDMDEFDIIRNNPIMIPRINFSWFIQNMLIHLLSDTLESWLRQDFPDKVELVNRSTPFVYRLIDNNKIGGSLQIGCVEDPIMRVKRAISDFI